MSAASLFHLLLVLGLCVVGLVAPAAGYDRDAVRKGLLPEELHMPDLRVSPPCAAAEDIFPCTCYNYSTGRTYVDCDGLLDEAEAYRALHVPGYGPNPLAGLSMEYGYVATLSLDMFSDTTFQSVSITHNHLAAIEEGALEPLRNDLEIIYVQNCLITESIAHHTQGFPRLREIDMKFNLIEDISSMADIVTPTPMINTVDLEGNLLQNVPPKAFQSFPNVLIIDLSHNNISYIHPDAFYNLKAIEYIFLQSNNLNHLGSPDVGWVITDIALTYLDLGDCNIDTLEPGFTNGIYNGGSALGLDKNPMRSFPEEVFGWMLRNLSDSNSWMGYTGINFHNTWIDCDCGFLWVAIDGWLNAHLFGGHCGYRNEWPWVSIDDVDGEALQQQCQNSTPAPMVP